MKRLGWIVIAACLFSCESKETESLETIDFSNPAAEGFNFQDSDPQAIAIADSVMTAMGGRRAWDTTRYIQWNFFGRRNLLWDKQNHNVRIEVPGDSTIYIINHQYDTGRVFIKGKEITQPDSLQKLMKKGESIWINDSYWLVMPFKLKDSGVTLKYLRKDTLSSGTTVDVLQLTFDQGGDTPQNKYEIFIDDKDNLVKQWAFFADRNQETPSAVWPWDNYQNVSGLKLSFNRSDGKGPQDVKVLSTIDSNIFSSSKWLLDN